MRLTIAAVILAAANCGPRESVAERLEDGFGEVQVFAGLQNSGQIVELWASLENGTWTVLHTNPDGFTCVVGAGRGLIISEAIAGEDT